MYSPLVDEYRHNSPTKVEPVKDYRVNKEKWHRSSSPVHAHEPVYSPFASEYRQNAPTKVEPFKDYRVNEDKWHRSLSPVRAHERVYSPLASDYRQNSPTKVEPFKDYGVNKEKLGKPSSPVHVNRPQKVDDILTKVQNEGSRPKFSPLSSTYWIQNPGQNHKPIGNTGYYDHNRNKDTETKPAMITTDGWSRPNRALWASPPNATLSEPTNDIGTAIEYLKEAARPYSTTSPTSRYIESRTRGLEPTVYAETIDNLEAAKRYRDYKVPVEGGDYAGTIDSEEAKIKYGGSRV